MQRPGKGWAAMGTILDNQASCSFSDPMLEDLEECGVKI